MAWVILRHSGRQRCDQTRLLRLAANSLSELLHSSNSAPLGVSHTHYQYPIHNTPIHRQYSSSLITLHQFQHPHSLNNLLVGSFSSTPTPVSSHHQYLQFKHRYHRIHTNPNGTTDNNKEASPSSKVLKSTPAKNETPNAGWTVNEVVNLPNSVSMLRLLSGPVIAYWIINSQWSLAFPALTLAGISDWLDGHLARRSKQHSVLGSYLDPLADKVLIGGVVGALGYTGALPLPLVGVVIGRDVVLVGGAFIARAQSLKWKWPGVKEFFRITSPPSKNAVMIDQNIAQQETHAAPFIKPLFISKVNTALQLSLVSSCMLNAWMQWPGDDMVWILGSATAGTTVWSSIAYAVAYSRGKLVLMK